MSEKLLAYIGSEGMALLQKSMSHIDASNKEQYLNTLQVLPRAVLSWIFNLTKSIDKHASKKIKVPGIDLILDITKNTPTKYTGKLYNETTNHSFDNDNLANISMLLLKSIDCLDVPEEEVTDEAEAEIQKAINYMVQRFCFTDKISVKLSKSELNARCPDCNENIKLSEDSNKLCICFKSLNRHLYLSKNIDGSYKVNFPNSWSKANINLLIKALKKIG